MDFNFSNGTAKLSGSITFDDHDSLRSLLKEAQGSGGSEIVYDLSGVTAIDSAGIGALLMANDRLKREGKTLVLSGAAGETERSLQLAKISDIISTR
jgi:anti-anti-sigma factor